VYGLLDDFRERYSAYCEAYEAAGKDLATTMMTAQLQCQLSKHLPSAAATQAAAKRMANEASKKLGSGSECAAAEAGYIDGNAPDGCSMQTFR
jgi:hypothetical protein